MRIVYKYERCMITHTRTYTHIHLKIMSIHPRLQIFQFGEKNSETKIVKFVAH